MAYCHPTELSDGLYCSDLQLWGSDEPEHQRGGLFPLITEHDLYWEEEELVALLSKQSSVPDSPEIGTPLALIRRDAVNWILKIQEYYDFTALTAVLAVNYLDRFTVQFITLWDRPWMSQLTAVACLTLATKVEEAADVPPLILFQLGSTILFEEKTIQRMELLVLSSLQWNMNPVTPLSFVDYVVRRLGLKGRACSEFLRQCENLLLSLLPDLKLREFLPSVVAAAAMLHVIDGLEPRLAVECQSQLLGLMPIDEEKLESCRKFMLESSGRRFGKHKYGVSAELGSPTRGVMEGVRLLQLDSSKKRRTDPSFP